MIRCRTLGSLEISLDGEPAPAELLWKKNAALLVYLARTPDRRRTREHLCGLLWGDRPEEAARHSLNEALRVIRRNAGDDVVESDARQVTLSRTAVVLDVDELAALAETSDWEGAGGLIEGTFLDGFGVPDASDFEDWLSAERRSWQTRCVDVLVECALARMGRGDVTGAVLTAGEALRLDALSNAAVRAAMRASALHDERARALQIYEEFAERLAGELATEPSAETTRLADRIRRERTWRLPEALAPAESLTRRLPLVGRREELSGLLAAWRSSRAERAASLATITGEPGVGKTRLAEELASRARLDGGTVVGIRAVPADRAVPWSGLLGLCRGGLLEAPGLLAAPQPALAAIVAELPEWGERFRDVPPRPARRSLARAFPELLRPVAEEQPLLIFVDDAEWLDEESAGALARVLRDLENLSFTLLLAAGTPEGRERLDELVSLAGANRPVCSIALEVLGFDAVRELAAAGLPDYTDEELDRIARRIQADSAGLPLLAVELVHAVRGGLELGELAGAWPERDQTLEQTMPGELPEAVHAAIRVSYRRMSASAQRIAAAASVLDDRFTPEALHLLTELSGEEVQAALDELEWQRWLNFEPRGYAFVARIVKRVVASDMLTPGQRRRLTEAARDL